MGGGAFHLAMPSVVGVHLKGKLREGVGAKDIILELLRRETVKGGVGSIYEYFGEGISSLTVPQRSTITNMGAELGATCSIFPSDGMTRKFLAAMGRPDDWTEQAADDAAVYDRTVEIDLSALHPMAAAPHSPDAVTDVGSLSGKKVDQVVIGSCTNSSLDDLAAVARIVKGKNIAPGVEAGIAPGSRTTLMLAAKTGILEELIRAGFRILESACGPCIGQGFAPSSKGVTLRTFNRNFKGRSGTADAEVYLVSPETAAAAAITGVITDPVPLAAGTEEAAGYSLLDGASGGLGADTIRKAATDSGMLIAPLPPEQSADVEIIRGPNIKPCPVPPSLPRKLTLPVLLKTQDNVSTDDIMPAGAKVLPLRSNIPEISKFTFERIDPGFYERAMKQMETPLPSTQAGCIVTGGENYGQGSSREHAALAPMYLGVRAVIVKSFARIHRANLINYGILPIVFENPADYDKIRQNDILEIENIGEALEKNVSFVIRRTADGTVIKGLNNIDERSRNILLAGGLAAYTRAGGQ